MLLSAPETSSGLVAAWIEAIATVVAVLVAAAAAWFAYRQIRLTGRQMRDSAEQQARDSEERTRPYIGAEFAPSISGPRGYDILIVNHGQTAARGVQIRLTDGNFEAQSPSDQVSPALADLFRVGFDLAPGARMRLLWRLPDSPYSTPRGDMGAPAEAELAISYGWQPDCGAGRAYTDHIRYDLDTLQHLWMAPHAGSNVAGSSMETHAKNAELALRAIVGNIAELRR